MTYDSLARKRAIGWLGRPVVRLVHAADPVRLRLRDFRGAPPPGAGLICVYRNRNLSLVLDLVKQALHLEMSVALWALDSPSPSLIDQTIGSGPGARLLLLNRLCEALPPSTRGPLVVCDDDVVFQRGGLRELLAVTSAAGFGLAQPAHAPGSYVNHGITRARPLTLARVTSYVESGPVFIISPEWRSRVLPLPEDFGMGWGMELLWADLQKLGCRLGVVDAVTLRHVSPPAHSYDAGPEAGRLRLLMDARGIPDLAAVQRTTDAWRAWQQKPGWMP